MDLMNQIYKGYMLMKVRMKISYEAAKGARTIQEHFLWSIMKSYEERNAKGLVEDPYPPVSHEMLDDIMKLNLVAIKMDAEKMDRRKKIIE